MTTTGENGNYYYKFTFNCDKINLYKLIQIEVATFPSF